MITLAAFTAFIAASAAAPHSTHILARQSLNKGTYVSYNGDGSTGQGWPSIDKWVDFDTMWTDNLPMMTNSCSPYKVPNTTTDEANNIKTAINSIASSSKVDPRVILAAIMQESKGCVRVWSTVSPDGTVKNPGLMQDHDGTFNCNAGSQTAAGQVQTPCPPASITGMISDGTVGTASGAGYAGLGAASAANAQSVYEAARKYNSGSLSGNDLGGGGSTSSYCSDIANRLMGVVFDSTSWVHGAAGSGSSAPAASTSSPAAAAPTSSPAAAAPASGSGSCKTPVTVASGDTCWSIGNAHGLTTSALQTLNPSLSCTNLQIGATVCVA